MRNIRLVECPRDAMQGWKRIIPTAEKIEYLNLLLDVGFDTLDFGSFVSPKAIPQMADTAEVVKALSPSATDLLAIVANQRGAEEALKFERIQYLGFPFSVSPTFQLRNANSTIEESIKRVEAIQDLCIKEGKELVIYLSMGFGNPYGDPYDSAVLKKYTATISEMGIKIISLADTIGQASADAVKEAVEDLSKDFPQLEIGVHLHSRKDEWKEKLKAAIDGGTARIDGALNGIGGCPMAGDELVGNMDTALIMQYLNERNLAPAINDEALRKALNKSSQVFS